MRTINLQIISELKKFLETSVDNKEKYCISPKAFTRKRKLTFSIIVLMILNCLKRSLAIELVDFFQRIGKPEQLAGKSAFSMARKKLKSLFFEDWGKILLKTYYERIPLSEKLQDWKGFILLGVDGSTAFLFND